MERTWRGTWAGILTIIGGCIGIGIGAFIATIGAHAGAPVAMGMGMLGAIGAPLIGIGIVALISGIYALRRRIWGFALTGAILATICSAPLGVLAIIFVSTGKREFE